jgi:2-iminobutanoate/2-iminopropanoate deaminase
LAQRLRALADGTAPIGPYSLAAEGNGFVYLAGQAGIAADGSIPDSIADQTRITMDRLRAVLEAMDLTFADVVKTSIFLIDMDDFAPMNDVYATYFDSDPPARTTVAVAALPVKGLKVEIDMVAARS